MNTNDFAKVFDALMQETPYSHFDSGCDGIIPECRTCRFHRPFWKYQSCVFAECPYCCNPEPWFVAVDVCRALEIGNSSQAISRLDADEKMITLISNEGNKRGNPNMTVVNEPGLYTLILSSRKPEAKTFKRWITHDVIPMIRKTGCYMTDSVLERIRKDPTFTYTLAKAMLREKDRADALEAELNAAKPKADYYDAFVNPYDCTNIRTTAKELKIPERVFVRFLLAEGYMFRSPSNQLLPYNKKSNEGLFIVRDFVNHRFAGSQTFFTPKGKEVVRLHYMRLYGAEHPSGLAG